MVKVQTHVEVEELFLWEKCGILVVIILLRADKYESFIITEYNYKIQVSRIEGCKLVRQGDLAFDFTYGSCNSFLEPTPRILLCFSYDGTDTPGKVCHT